jgi:hypothetical protein
MTCAFRFGGKSGWATAWMSGRAILVAAALCMYSSNAGRGYAFDQIVPDVRQPVSFSGGSACPVRAHQLSSPGRVAVRWSTPVGTTPVSIVTQDQTSAGRLNEVEHVIAESPAAWTSVAGTTLSPASLAPLTRVATATACSADGVNSICFDQADGALTPGVLAFHESSPQIESVCRLGIRHPLQRSGQILDADIYFNPGDSQVSYATPAALAANPHSHDLESLLTHELGHFLGFSHSAVWNAMMYPYAPAPGTFTGMRPATQRADAPLGDDDRNGLRVLYPSATDTVNIGSIRGRVLPANVLSLPASLPGVSGVFGAHVVAVDADSGAVIAGTIGGWSCSDPGPVQFDGSHEIDRLPVGHNYTVYAEPLDGVVAPEQIAPAMVSLCRNATTDAGWPPLQACMVPKANTSFTTRVRPGS